MQAEINEGEYQWADLSDNSKIIMSCLGLELTRRCNLQCDFCCKGDSQNLDMSKEIIGKTFSEVQGAYIRSICLHGGEPLLVPDLIKYTIDKLIEYRIIVSELYFFTNGCHTPDLKDHFLKILNYIKDIKVKYYNFAEFMKDVTIDTYPITGELKIIISRFHHDVPIEKAKNTYNYFRQQITADGFDVMIQPETQKEIEKYGLSDAIILSGKAKENFNSLIGNEISTTGFTVLDNNFCVIESLSDKQINQYSLVNRYIINKTISISSNGNVYPGRSMSFNEIDMHYMFNILDCDNNFFKRIDNWCWKNPISKSTILLKRECEKYIFCRDHRIILNDIDKKTMKYAAFINGIIELAEKKAIEIHSKGLFPTLSQSEIFEIASAETLIEFYTGRKNNNSDYNTIINQWMVTFVKFTFVNDAIEIINFVMNPIKYCKELINYYKELNRKNLSEQIQSKK